MTDQGRISPYQINTISNRKMTRKKKVRYNKLIHYQILRTYVIRIEWQNGRRITELILGVKGLIQLCHYHPCLQHYNHHFFVQSLLVNASEPSLAKMTMLFFLMGMVTKETHQLPVQSLPFPVYPGSQVHTYDPLVFVHVAFT